VHDLRHRSFSSFAAAVLGLAVLSVGADAAPVGSRSDRAERLERFSARLGLERERLHIPGLSVAVVMDGEVVLARGFGVCDIEAGRPASEGTIYAVGSTTKAFTSTLIAMLVDDGKMGWDDAVRRHLPLFRLKDADADAHVTIRDLLCHRTGLPSMDMLWYAGESTWPDMRVCIARAEPIGPFRASFNYNNPMYMAAGTAAGLAVGSDWSTLLAQRILKPLGMSDTTTSVAAAQADVRLALGYRWDEAESTWVHQPMRTLDNIAPAGAINSNVTDMAKWIRFLLARGEVDGRRLVSREQLMETWRSQIEMQPTIGYGLGWAVRGVAGHRVLEHSGGIDGFTAHVTLLPDAGTEGVGCVLLSNLGNSPLPVVATSLVIEFLLEDARKGPALDPAEMLRYVGAYRFDAMNADLTVLEREDGLAVDVPGQTVFGLEPPDADGHWSFRGFDDIAVSFAVNEDGDGGGVSMTLYQAGMTFVLPRVEIPGAESAGIDEATAAPYFGDYRLEGADRDVEVFVQSGRLAINMAGREVFELDPPKEGDRWRFHETPEVTAHFARNANGDVVSLTVSQRCVETRMPRIDPYSDDPGAELPLIQDVMRIVREKRGTTAYASLFNLTMTGTVEWVNLGMTGTVKVLASGYDRYWVRRDFPPFGWVQASCVGRFGYYDSAFEPFTSLEDEMQAQMRLQHPAVLLDYWATHFEEGRVLRVEKQDDHEVIVVRLDPPDLEPMTIHVRSDNGWVIRSEGVFKLVSGVTLPTVTVYEDYRDVAGVMLPFRTIEQIDEALVNQVFPDEPWYMTPPNEKGQ